MAVTMTLAYDGDLRCELKHESQTTIQTDAPKDNEGRGEAFSPTDLVGAALVSCAVTTMAIKGPKEGIAFPAARGRVVKEMSSTPPRKIARLALEIEMPAGLALSARGRLEEIARTCPVALSLSAGVVVSMDFRYPA